MTDLRFVDYLADTALVREARKHAEELLERDPELASHPGLRALIREDEEQVEAS